MNHAEVILARQAVEEGRGLVVIVNKMDLLSSKKNSDLCEKVRKAVPEEIQTVIPQVFQLAFQSEVFIIVSFLVIHMS